MNNFDQIALVYAELVKTAAIDGINDVERIASSTSRQIPQSGFFLEGSQKQIGDPNRLAHYVTAAQNINLLSLGDADVMLTELRNLANETLQCSSVLSNPNFCIASDENRSEDSMLHGLYLSIKKTADIARTAALAAHARAASQGIHLGFYPCKARGNYKDLASPLKLLNDRTVTWAFHNETTELPEPQSSTDAKNFKLICRNRSTMRSKGGLVYATFSE